MFVKVSVSTTLLVEVDDKFTELAETYAADGGEWDCELAEELAETIHDITGIPCYDPDTDYMRIGVARCTAVYTTDDEAMMEY